MAAAAASSDAHFEATAHALNAVTDHATAENHSIDPLSTLHRPADQEHAHSWMKKLFPASTLQHVENSFHMGNYVIDRKTGEKNWEPMSIYVRIGMHALYYGSAEERALHWNRTLALLKSQTEKMGREYDSPTSVNHITPFIQSFNLGPSMAEMKEPDPTKYKTFNDFFSREIREDARPIDEPQDVGFETCRCRNAH